MFLIKHNNGVTDSLFYTNVVLIILLVLAFRLLVLFNSKKQKARDQEYERTIEKLSYSDSNSVQELSQPIYTFPVKPTFTLLCLFLVIMDLFMLTILIAHKEIEPFAVYAKQLMKNDDAILFILMGGMAVPLLSLVINLSFLKTRITVMPVFKINNQEIKPLYFDLKKSIKNTNLLFIETDRRSYTFFLMTEEETKFKKFPDKKLIEQQTEELNRTLSLLPAYLENNGVQRKNTGFPFLKILLIHALIFAIITIGVLFSFFI